MPWGGMSEIGTVGTFYVSVNGMMHDGGVGVLGLTGVNSEAEVDVV